MTDTNMFVSTLPDIPRIITAVAEWLACLVCVLPLQKRKKGLPFVGLCVAFFVIQSLYMMLTDRFDGILWNLCMAGAVLLMFGFIRIGTVTCANNAVVCCCAAFISSEFAASLEWQVWCYVQESMVIGNLIFCKSLILILTYGLVFLVMWQLCRSIWETEVELNASRRDTLTTLLITVVIFAVSNLGFLPVRVPFAGRDSLEIFNLRTLVDLGGLAVLYAWHLQWKSASIGKELTAIQTILDVQYEQYKQTQRTMDMINYRYHDLKNHIIALRGNTCAPERQEYLEKLEREIHDYEALNKTGNQVLDTVLTSKNLRCMQHKIDMTCVINGSLFDFMDVLDICSVFGNAIDNAIECELKIKDYEKRMIHVDAFSEKSFIIIRFENYYEGSIKFVNGLPATTKEENSIHGYGLKSLRYTVHKYGGEIQIDTKDQWFSLRVLIPQ